MSPRGAFAPVAVLLAALLLTGCGAVGRVTSGDPSQGKQLFTDKCGSCHTLADAKSTRTVGPNLDQLKPNQDAVDRQVTNGGGGMPPFKGQLTAAEIQAGSKYVADNAGK